jgi:hypothetical protein
MSRTTKRSVGYDSYEKAGPFNAQNWNHVYRPEIMVVKNGFGRNRPTNTNS